MDYGIVLPAMGEGSSRDGLEAAAELAELHGFTDVWGTDHVLVPHAAEDDYGRIYEILTTLAWLAGRFRRVRLGTSVIVIPMRSAVVVAKQLATLDELSGGRLTVGLGAGWNAAEFENVGAGDRFRVRGAYLEESIRLFRHLWSGSGAPFHGRFHAFEDFTFAPLPPQGAGLPIWLGGRDRRALERAGRLADGYHSSGAGPEQLAERVPVLRAAADAAGRPMPVLSARIRVELEDRSAGGTERRPDAGAGAAPSPATLRGRPDAVAARIRRFEEVGVSHLAIAFPEQAPDGLRRSVERFVEEVRPLV